MDLVNDRGIHLASAGEFEEGNEDAGDEGGDDEVAGFGTFANDGADAVFHEAGELQGHFVDFSCAGAEGITQREPCSDEGEGGEEPVHVALDAGDAFGQGGKNLIERESGGEVGEENGGDECGTDHKHFARGAAGDLQVGEEEDDGGKGAGVDAVEKASKEDNGQGEALETLLDFGDGGGAFFCSDGAPCIVLRQGHGFGEQCAEVGGGDVFFYEEARLGEDGGADVLL